MWGAELKKAMREEGIRTVWQPVVELESGAFYGFEALARGPVDSMFEMPRAMFALSGPRRRLGDLDRLCRAAAFREEPASLRWAEALRQRAPDDALGRHVERRARCPSCSPPAGARPRTSWSKSQSARSALDAASLVAGWEALRQEGFALALDDVGTGRDGGEVLDCLRPDFLKVDASVVRGIDANLVKQEIFATIAKAGDTIDARLVAVGVESAEEAATLRRLGARYAQGYHFAGPGPARAVGAVTVAEAAGRAHRRRVRRRPHGDRRRSRSSSRSRRRRRKDVREIVVLLEEMRSRQGALRLDIDPRSPFAPIAESANRLGQDLGVRWSRAETANGGFFALQEAARGYAVIATDADGDVALVLARRGSALRLGRGRASSAGTRRSCSMQARGRTSCRSSRARACASEVSKPAAVMARQDGTRFTPGSSSASCAGTATTPPDSCSSSGREPSRSASSRASRPPRAARAESSRICRRASRSSRAAASSTPTRRFCALTRAVPRRRPRASRCASGSRHPTC